MPAASQSPAKTHPAGHAPERSLTQRMDALQRANDIRTRRAKLKRDLKAGRPDPRAAAGSARIRAHRQGLRPAPRRCRSTAVKVNRILTHCRISPSKTIGGSPSGSATSSSRTCADSPDPGHHRAVRSRQGNAHKVAPGAGSRPPAGRLADHSRPASGGGERGRLPLPEPGRFRPPRGGRRVRGARGLRRQQLRHAAQRAGAAGAESCSRSTSRARARCARRSRRRCGSSSSRLVRVPGRAAHRPRLDSPEQIERGWRRRARSWRRATSFQHHVCNDDLERAVQELAQLAATM